MRAAEEIALLEREHAAERRAIMMVWTVVAGWHLVWFVMAVWWLI